MSAYDEWLANAETRRHDAGLTRRTIAQPRRDQIDLAGNDYLRLRHDERVQNAAIEAIETHGTGAGASRLVTGTMTVHDELESALCSFTKAEAALVFSTGYQANLGVLAALADEETLIVSDAHNHASLIDGARLSRGTIKVVPHLDVEAVALALATRTQPRAIVVTESIFSVLGDAAPLAELIEVTRRYDALLLVDEAHAIGVSGDRGQGLVASLGLIGPDVVVTTSLSKSLAAQGGAVLSSLAIREHLVNAARPFIYDTGLAPAAAGAALEALSVLRAEPELIGSVRAAAATLAEACKVPPPAGAVLSVAMPSARAALAVVDICAAHRVRIGCFRPPSTPDGISRVRLTAHAGMPSVDLNHAATTLTGAIHG